MTLATPEWLQGRQHDTSDIPGKYYVPVSEVGPYYLEWLKVWRSQDHPRDSRGRFTSSGGGGGGSSGGFTNREEAAVYVKDQTGIDVDFSRMDMQAVNEISEALVDLQKEYPETAKMIKLVSMPKGSNLSLGYGIAAHTVLTGLNGKNPRAEIEFNEFYFKDFKELRLASVDAEKSGVFTKGSSAHPARSIAIHEYGHVLDYKTHYSPQHGSQTRSEDMKFRYNWENKSGMTRKQISERREKLLHISQYATRNDWEAFSEGFLYMKNHPGDDKHEYVRDLSHLLEVAKSDGVV